MAAPSGRWAAAVVVPADFLNALAAHGIGEGVVAPPFRNIFSMPMLGPIELSVSMTIVSVSFEMRAGDGDRLRATVRAHGDIEFHGDMPMAMDVPSAIVAGEVLVEPVVELRPGRRRDTARRDAEAIYHLAFGVLHVALRRGEPPTAAEAEHLVRFSINGTGGTT